MLSFEVVDVDGESSEGIDVRRDIDFVLVCCRTPQPFVNVMGFTLNMGDKTVSRFE